jgi:putative membrane protein insertion efficiency factor
VIARLLVLLVRGYQRALSPLLGDRCKYHPTCSQYAVDALCEHGALRGTVLAAWRVLRCNPWSAGGVDHAHDQTLFRRRAEERHA